MLPVAAAEQIIMAQQRNYGTEAVHFETAIGRVLAEDIVADRDMPPCDRVTMDGIAISYAAFEKGIRSFTVIATIAAGDIPTETQAEHECVEIMTGAALPATLDTVIRYEDVAFKDGKATLLTETIRTAQNIHRKGKDKKQGDVVTTANRIIDATVISMAASVGKDTLLVKKLPKVVVISTGDELVDVTAKPTPYQVRRSNSYTVKAVLEQYRMNADMLHLPDEPKTTKQQIADCLTNYDVIILSGGVSMGKFDYVPQALEELSVTQLLHKVQQRPGKPFWFGRHADGALVFAFPGNPVSTFMCLHRYFVPWLENVLQTSSFKYQDPSPKFAILNKDVTFIPPLQYFVQVKLHMNEQGHLLATPMEGNGSGDFANLLDTDAFMELPMEESNFKKGTAYKIWPFKKFI